MGLMKLPSPALLICLALGCAGNGPERTLPFDTRPAMRSMLEDAAEIARVLGSGRSLDALRPARRLADVRLGEGQPRPAEFQELQERFRDAAAALADALDSRAGPIGSDRADQQEHGVLFKRVLERCDACHVQYRPGGISGL